MKNTAFLSAVRLEELEVKYAKVLEDDPASDCFVPLSQLLMIKRKTDEALKVLTRGILHNKENVTARYLRGKIYFERWMVDKARKEFEMVVRFDPGNIDASKVLLQIYSSKGNFGAALNLARNLCFCHPNNEEIKNLFNQITEIDSVGKDGRRNFRSAVYLPQNKSCQNNDLATETLANLYFNQGHYDQAVQILDILLQQDPFNMKLLQKRREIENLK